MSWKSITTGSILTTLTQAEYTRYNTVSTSSLYTADTMVQEIINDAVAECRSYIQGCPRNRVDANVALIPASCVPKVKAIIVHNLMSRVAGKISDVNSSRKDDYDKAYEFLSKISSGDIGIDLPDNPIQVAQYNQFFGTSATPINF